VRLDGPLFAGSPFRKRLAKLAPGVAIFCIEDILVFVSHDDAFSLWFRARQIEHPASIQSRTADEHVAIHAFAFEADRIDDRAQLLPKNFRR